MCERKRGVPVRAVLAAVGGAAAVSLAVAWLSASWPLVLAVTAVLVAVSVTAGWAVSKASRWAARLAIVHWPSMEAANIPAPAAVNIRAVAAPPRELEAPVPVLEGVIIGAREAAR